MFEHEYDMVAIYLYFIFLILSLPFYQGEKEIENYLLTVVLITARYVDFS